MSKTETRAIGGTQTAVGRFSSLKLQTKLLLVLLAGLLTVFSFSSLIQRYSNLTNIQGFAGKNQTEEAARQWQWVESLQNATDAALVGAMAEGEMDRFAKILEAQRSVPGLQELSLYNLEGVVAYSSQPDRLKKVLPHDLKTALLSSPDQIKRRTPASFELFRPLRAEKACTDCHSAWRPDQICGVMAMRFSSDSLNAAEKAWVKFEEDFGASSLAGAGVTALALLVIGGFLVSLAVRFQVANPLKRIATSLSCQAEDVASAASVVRISGDSLANDACSQAASLEQTSASLEELSAMTRQNAGSAQQSKALAQQAREAADHGAVKMRQLSGAMEAIKLSSDDIAKIIKTIDGIAFQTNILALNASVEAARAGAAGLGFAVVADEVRALAQRSAHAAKETASKIEGALARTAQGVQLSGEVVAILDQIVIRAREVDALAAQVATASGEQSQGIASLNSAIRQMDKITQGNAANAEQGAGAAAQLNAQAESMRGLIGGLLKLVGAEISSQQGEPLPKARRIEKPTVTRIVSDNSLGNRPAILGSRTPASMSRSRPEFPMDGDLKDF